MELLIQSLELREFVSGEIHLGDTNLSMVIKAMGKDEIVKGKRKEKERVPRCEP